MSWMGMVTWPPWESLANLSSASARLSAEKDMEKLVPEVGGGPKAAQLSLPINTLEPMGRESG